MWRWRRGAPDAESATGGGPGGDVQGDADAGGAGTSAGSSSSASSSSDGSTSSSESESESGSESDSDSDSDSQNDDDEDADAALRRSLLGSFVKVKRHVLNSHLVCTICNGYFRDAHTVQECLHTFCKVCITLHAIKSHNKCPTCQASLGHNMQDVRPDHTLQSLVGKLYPEYGPSADAAAKIAFYEARGIKRKVREFPPATSNPAQIARPPPSAAAIAEAAAVGGAGLGDSSARDNAQTNVERNAVSETAKSEQTAAISDKITIDLTKFKAEDDNFNALNDEELAIANFAIDDAEELPFRLVPDKSVRPDLRLADLDKPFLRTSSELTVKMLIKFLRHKVAKKEDSAFGIELTSLVSTNLIPSLKCLKLCTTFSQRPHRALCSPQTNTFSVPPHARKLPRLFFFFTIAGYKAPG